MAFTPDQSFWLLVAILWMLPWKGWALWRAARNSQRIWFAVFMLVHTLGILEILYLASWSGLRWNRGAKKSDGRKAKKGKRK